MRAAINKLYVSCNTHYNEHSVELKKADLQHMNIIKNEKKNK